MPRHSVVEMSAPATAYIPAARHRRRRSSHRRPARPGRVVLAVGGTALAAVLGGVFSGVVPAPPGVPSSLVVAGDPAGARPVMASGPSAASPAAPATRSQGSPPGGAAGGGPAPSGTAGARVGGTSASPSAAGGAASTSPTAGPTSGGTASPVPAGGTAAPSAAASAGAAQTADAQVLALVNQQRAANGCGALTVSPALGRLAAAFSTEMAAEDFFSHIDPAGRTPWDRAAAAGITDLGGENIARGQQTPAEVMTAWMHSPGHRANILNCAYHVIGVGVHYGPGGPWWTQDFGF